MKKLYSLIAEQMEQVPILEKSAKPKGTRKPLIAKAAKMVDPVHVKRVGVMERHHAEKFYPEYSFTSTRLYKKEATENVETISMTIPLFIRCLEWAHENCPDDIELHKFVERCTEKSGVLDTDDYESLVPEGDSKE